jgi:hypothetical protein
LLSSNQKPDYSKVADFEIALIVAKRDSAQFEKERYDEILNAIGQVRGFADAGAKAEQKTCALITV